MTKFGKWFKSFISNRDFADAVKSVADDLKVAAGALFGLGVLSLLPKLPAPLLPLAAALGLSAVKVSAWVTWLLFAVAAALYVAQFWLRVTRRQPAARKRDVQQLQIGSTQNGNPRGRGASRGRRSDSGNPAGSLAALLKRFTKTLN